MILNDFHGAFFPTVTAIDSVTTTTASLSVTIVTAVFISVAACVHLIDFVIVLHYVLLSEGTSLRMSGTLP